MRKTLLLFKNPFIFGKELYYIPHAIIALLLFLAQKQRVVGTQGISIPHVQAL